MASFMESLDFGSLLSLEAPGMAFNDQDNVLVNATAPFEDVAPLDMEAFNQELEKATNNDNSNSVLTSSWMEDASADINEAFMNNLSVIEDPKMIQQEEPEETQNLIDEMEAFLKEHEITEQDQGNDDVVMDEKPNTNALTDEESKQAEAILDALIKGNITTDGNGELTDSGFMDNISMEDLQDQSQTCIKYEEDTKPVTNFNSISNISELVTEDGQKIVIVIANDTNQANIAEVPKFELSSETSAESPMGTAADSDSDWTPSSPQAPKRKGRGQKRTVNTTAVQEGRVGKKRGPYKRSAHANIVDKRERKKLQNVEAARRYRDKKKVEAYNVEEEEEVLARKNNSLKAKVSEMENELKTLKKLMTELGLVKQTTITNA